MNDKPTEEIKKLPTITKFCMTIGELPTSYLMSLTYLEQVTWLCNFLEKTMIPALNQNAKAVEELQSLFELLRTYVNDYFDNLDVQEEINNKLDEMLEDGALEQIIEQYLNSSAIWGFDTVADMKEATNLIDGSYARTLGYYEPNDGGGSTYKIRTKTNDAVPNEYDLISLYDENLVAEYIENETVNIKQLGYIDTMTEAIQTSFLNYVFNTYKNILIKNENITINNSLQVKSNQSIKMISSKIHNTSTTNQTFIFQLTGVSNVNIDGINSELYFDKPNLPQQACLKIVNSHNIYFNGIDMKNAGGDGATISGSNNENNSTNINISNCTIDNSNRNGISVIGGVKGLNITNCILSNTSGLNPQYAIDLETWQDEVYNEYVTIENCSFISNVGGIDLMPFNNNIKIINCVFLNNTNNIQSTITESAGINGYPKNILISGNTFETKGIYLRGTQYAEYTIENNNFKAGGISTDSESDFTQFFNSNAKSGFVIIKNNNIKNALVHGLSIVGSCNVLIEGNIIEKPFNRCVNIIQCNNVNIVNNTFRDHAQNETDTSEIKCVNCSTTHNIKIEGNIFIDTGETTFTSLILFDANCQKVIITNNNALNSLYNNFVTKYGTITNEVNANNLTNN